MTRRRETGLHENSENSFDLVRLVAATAVLFDHSWLVNGLPNWQVFSWHSRSMMAGGLAVSTFFAISGYLISGSWLADDRLAAFLCKRALRLFPALALVVLVSVFVIGPAFTALSLSDYLHSGTTWSYLGTVTLTPVRTLLPGVFTGNPLHVVNGSLWTLPYELICYLVVAVTGFTKLLQRRWPILVLLLLTAIGSVAASADTTLNLVALMSFFFAGAVIRGYNLPLTGRGAGVALVVLASTLITGVYLPALGAISYLAIYLGSRRTRAGSLVARRGDASYGTYVYGMPVQQSLVAAGIGSPWLLFAASAPVVLGLGFLSWHRLEHPVMRWGRRRLTAQRTPERATVAAVVLTPTAS